MLIQDDTYTVFDNPHQHQPGEASKLYFTVILVSRYTYTSKEA